ncbi:MAG: conjugal transfer protein TraG N-terminal domain-containing protein, partial [Rubrivivax sp.]|nr:conjugal transfer protein TraG N-terminal domain-containing protein [Rubrivivax sp.]
MFPDLTLYTIWGDLGLLTAILNGMAMIANQSAFVWGFAIMASTYGLLSMTARTVMTSNGAAGAAMGGVGKLIIPLVLAMMLTGPGFRVDVTVESSTSGRTTVVRVPWMLAIIPAVSSQLSKEASELVSTAFQSTGTDYSMIEAQRTGFINPLKSILSARTAATRLHAVAPQVEKILSSCLGSDSGIALDEVRQKALNVGNSAGRASGMAMAIPGSGTTNPTALGSLLLEASRNVGGYVPDVMQGSSATTFLSCNDAAVKVVEEIGAALSSQEFARVSMGSVSSNDQLSAGVDRSFVGLANNYRAVRTSNESATVRTLVDGAGQANAELLNFIFYEIVDSNLKCLNSAGDVRVQCMAQAQQAAELQRAELAAAANATQVVKFAGQFAAYMTALCLALGPLIVMILMFAGVTGHALASIVAAVLLPQLTIEVGAVIIHNMMVMDVAAFWTTLAQGGYISQAVTHEAFKQLALKIGTASQLMAALPAILAGLFVAFRHAGSSSAASMAKDTATAGAVTPQLTSGAPVLQQRAMAEAEHLGGGTTRLSMAGALPTVAASTMVSHGKEWAATAARAESREKSRSSGEELSRRLSHAQAFTSIHGVDFTSSQVQAIQESYRKHYDASGGVSANKSHNTNKSDDTNASVNMGGGVGLGGVNLSAGGTTGTGARDGNASGTGASQDESVRRAQAMDKALTESRERARRENWGTSQSEALDRAAGDARTYSESLSQRNSTTFSDNDTERAASNLVSSQRSIGMREFARQLGSDGGQQVNGGFATYIATTGQAFAARTAAQPYLQAAQQRVESGSHDELRGMGANARMAQEAARLHWAAAQMVSDERLPAADRIAAANYLAGGIQAMTGQNIGMPVQNNTVKGVDETPTNRTGLQMGAIDKDTGKGKPPALPLSGSQPASA